MMTTTTETRETYTEYCKNYIKENIYNHEGANVYACDLGDTLTEGINIDGSATYSTYEAKEYIKAWFDDAAMVHDYMQFNFGEIFINPFEEPERFHCFMIIEGVNCLLSQCETIDSAWNEEIELTPETIEKILLEVDEIDGDIEL